MEDRLLLSIMVDTFDDVVAADGRTSLREALDQAATSAGAETILLPAGTYALTLGPLTINDPTGKVTIQAHGGVATIDAQGLSRVFRVTSASEAEFQGLTITGGSADFGGGLANYGRVTITHSTLSANGAGDEGFGGGLYNASTARITIANSTLNDNAAGFGGGLYNRGRATITDSTLSRNAASIHGGGLANAGRATITITNSTLDGNRSFGGGGLANYGRATIADSTLSGNEAEFGGGGGISNAGTATITITHSTLNRNATIGERFGHKFGGGLYNRGRATITDSILSRNLASDGGFGGGLYNAGTARITIANSTLNDNAAGFGGGLANRGTATITTGTLRGNMAIGGAFSRGGFGGGLYNGGTARITITTSTLSRNAAFGEPLRGDLGGGLGGGLYNRGRATIIASTLSHNAAVDEGFGGKFGGGGLYNHGRATILASTLSRNAADGSEGFGGGLYNSGRATITITASSLSGNTAGLGGGLANRGVARVRNTIVAGNRSEGSGPDVRGAFARLGYNLIGIGDGATGFGAVGDQVGTAARPIRPKLGPLQDNGGPTFTHALLPGSPALDAGAPDLAGTTDQRGVLRPQGPGVDIGAFERTS